MVDFVNKKMQILLGISRVSGRGLCALNNGTCKNRLCPPVRHFSYTEAIAGLWTTLSNSAPVTGLQHGLIQLHDVTGMPWWATIAVSTIALRTMITLPLAVYQQKNMAKFEKVATIDLPELSKQLKVETAIAVRKFDWTEEEAKRAFNASLRKQYSKLIVKENCHPAKSMVILWGQIPLWVTQSMAIRNLVQLLPNPDEITAQIAYTELTLGGFSWIPNLTQVDASYILPVALGILNLLIIECQTRVRVKPPGKLQKVMTNFFRGLSVLMVPVACTVPAGLSFYWVMSSAYGLAQCLLLMSPKFKRIMGFPIIHSENPYRHIINSFAKRK